MNGIKRWPKKERKKDRKKERKKLTCDVGNEKLRGLDVPFNCDFTGKENPGYLKRDNFIFVNCS